MLSLFHSSGNGYFAAYGLHCNFHYGYVHDVFDEDAKNEEACVQALRHLIAKADAEIDDLEDELAIIQCQHKWAEPDEHKIPFEVCCAAFQSRIDSMASSIQRLNNGVETPSQIQKPAERIYDIIDALIRSKSMEPDEQERDLCYEKNLVVSPGSLVIDTDVGQQATTLELIMESEKQTPVLEKLDEDEQPTQTVSEESSSDIVRYTSKELTDVRSMGSSNIKVSQKIQSSGHASEGISGLLTSIETITSRTPLKASNDEGNSKSSAPQHGEIVNCMGGSKTGGSGSSTLAPKTEVILKVEQDGDDASIQIDSGGSFSRVQDHEGEDSVDEAQSVSDLEITYSRKKSGLSNILKPLGHKVKKKNLDAVRPFIPSLTLKLQKTMMKRKSSSIEENSGLSGSPSSEIQRHVRNFPEANWRRKPGTEENAACGNSLQVSQSKRHQPKGARRDVPVIPSPKRSRDEKWSLASKSPGGIIVCLKSKATELPIVDMEYLKKKLSEEPSFLNKLNVPKLKGYAKLCKIRGVSKFKKETLIEELIKCLTAV